MPGVYSVAQVNAYIKTIFSRDAAFARITVRGEVSNCRYPDTGTVYFTLKDQQAAISCVLFQTNRAGLTFRLQDGQQIDATGQISVYEKTGVYQLYVRSAVRTGAGELYERYLQLKEKLSEMGMFDPGYKKPIPQHAMRIGIVTAEGGAAIQDIIRVSRQKNPYAKLYLRPALVQGQYAAAGITDAIRFLDSLHLDVLIVGRGGGSIEDLWAFNEETVAQAIFDCETPVISAVGHETDFTIADFVADLRAATPTQAAELANFDVRAFEEQCSAGRDQLFRLMMFKLNAQRQKTETAGARLEKAGPASGLQRMREQLKSFRFRLNGEMTGKVRSAALEEQRFRQRAELAMERRAGLARHRLEILTERLDAASPLKRIRGGFGYLTAGGKGICRVTDVAPGDEMTAYLSDGKITATVGKTERAAVGAADGKESIWD